MAPLLAGHKSVTRQEGDEDSDSDGADTSLAQSSQQLSLYTKSGYKRVPIYLDSIAIGQWNQKFNSVTTQLERDIRETVQPSELKRFLFGQSHILYPESKYIDPLLLAHADSVPEILDALTPQYINYLNWSLLLQIADTFNPQSRHTIEEYTSISQFSPSTRLKTIPDPLSEDEIVEHHGVKRLTVTRGGGGSDWTLGDVWRMQTALEKATGINRGFLPFAYWESSNSGHEFTFLIPKDCSKIFEDLSREDKNILDICGLQINYSQVNGNICSEDYNERVIKSVEVISEESDHSDSSDTQELIDKEHDSSDIHGFIDECKEVPYGEESDHSDSSDTQELIDKEHDSSDIHGFTDECKEVPYGEESDHSDSSDTQELIDKELDSSDIHEFIDECKEVHVPYGKESDHSDSKLHHAKAVTIPDDIISKTFVQISDDRDFSDSCDESKTIKELFTTQEMSDDSCSSEDLTTSNRVEMYKEYNTSIVSEGTPSCEELAEGEGRSVVSTKGFGLEHLIPEDTARQMNRKQFSRLTDLITNTPPGKLQEECSDHFLHDFAKVMQSWKDLAPYFGVNEWRVEEIEENYPNEDDQKYQALLCWKRIDPSTATYEGLVECLLSHGHVMEVFVLLVRLPKGRWMRIST